MKHFIFAVVLLLSFPILAANRHNDGDYVIVLNGNESPDVVMRQHGVGKRIGKDHQWDKVPGYHGFSAHLNGKQADDLEADTRVAVIEEDVAAHILAATPNSFVWVKDLSTKVSNNYGATVTSVATDPSGNVYVAGSLVGQVDFGGGTVTAVANTDIFLAKYSPDSTLLWFKQFGTAGNNRGFTVAYDNGSVFLGGSLKSANFGGGVLTSAAISDAFIAKFNATTGAYGWAFNYGAANGGANTYSVALDSSHNVIITGTFQFTVNFGGGGLTSLSSSQWGNTDIFVAKYSGVDGSYIWALRRGDTALETPSQVAVDSAGNVYITGNFYAYTDLGAGQVTAVGTDDIFIVKYLGTDGSYVWGKTFGNTGTDGGKGIAIDSTGNVVVTGQFTGSINFGMNTVVTSAGNSGQFLARFTNAGVNLWAKGFGGLDQNDASLAVATDAAGNILITGYASGSINFGGGYLLSFGAKDMTVAEFTSAGVYEWAKRIGGPAIDSGASCAINALGDVLVGGTFQSTVNFGGGPITVATTGATDGYVVKFGSTQTIPTGIRRIGTIYNSIANIGSRVNVNADIAIVDTGVQLNHPDLNVYTNVTFVSGTTTGNDDNGHGTHVAGIAAAIDNNIGVVGVCPGARIWAVKIADSTGGATLSTMISGVDWVTQNAANIEVANMSVGGQGSSASLRLAIQASVAKGVLWTVAAGNGHFEIYGGDKVFGTSDDFFPASYPEVMCVSAMADSDGLAGGTGTSMTVPGWPTMPDDTMATFSNYSLSAYGTNVISPGAAIDVAAPGVNILSTMTNSTYSVLSGTSMAAPHAAGAAALYIVFHGKPGDANAVYAVRQALVDTAEPQTRWGVNLVNPDYLFDYNPEGLLSVGSFTPVGAIPSLAITLPVAGFTAAATDNIHFVGASTDAEDGNLGAQIVWTDSMLGRFQAGTNFFYCLTNAGTHVIAARVTDSDGNVTNKTVSISLTNPIVRTPPIIVITCPTNNVVLPFGGMPAFTATATDSVDGNIVSRLNWWDGRSGIFYGQGSPITITLPVGNYYFLAETTNSAGMGSATPVAFAVGSGPTNPPPTITILSPLSGQQFPRLFPVVFTAQAYSSMYEDLSANITWSSSLDGALGSGPALTNSTLSVGSHVITATVFDNGTFPNVIVQTNTAKINLTVFTPSPTTLAVTASSNKGTYHAKEKATLTANVKASGVNVQGAAVTFQISFPSGTNQKTTYASVTTDANGNAVYLWPVTPSAVNKAVSVVVNATKSPYTAGTATFSFNVIR